jgi:superoxide dismutase
MTDAPTLTCAQHLTKPLASSKDKASKGFLDAVTSSFGSWDKMIADMTTAGTRVFGSGWSWLCYLSGMYVHSNIHACMYSYDTSICNDADTKCCCTIICQHA